MPGHHDRVLRQQIEYYRARAAEYDEWFYRRGRYDHGPELNRLWFAEVDETRDWLDGLDIGGAVLEIACGTGNWTERLAPRSTSLTALDASPEMLAINRGRVDPTKVRHLEVDVFDWTPDASYDVIFAGFWLSHIPPDRFEEFWRLLDTSLVPGGRVLFVDSRPDPTSSAVDHAVADPGDVTSLRRLNDNRTFEILKVFYEPARLTEQLGALGWDARIQTTAHYFLFGAAVRSGGPAV